MRLPAIAHLNMYEHILFKATFIIRNGLNTSFKEPENSTLTILVSDNQISRLDEDNVKTEPSLEETISQSEPQVKNTDVGSSH